MPRGLSLHSLDLTASARVPGAEVVSFGVFHPLNRARITAGNDRDGTSAEGPPLATTACSRTSRIRRRSSGRERAADLPFGTSLCARDLPSRSTARPSAMVSSCSTRQTTCDLDAACFPASLRDPVTCSCFCPVGRPGATNCTGHPPRHCIRKTARPVLHRPRFASATRERVEAPPSGLRMTARNPSNAGESIPAKTCGSTRRTSFFCGLPLWKCRRAVTLVGMTTNVTRRAHRMDRRVRRWMFARARRGEARCS